MNSPSSKSTSLSEIQMTLFPAKIPYSQMTKKQRELYYQTMCAKYKMKLQTASLDAKKNTGAVKISGTSADTQGINKPSAVSPKNK